MKIALFLFLATLLGSCGTPSETKSKWTKEERDVFLETCITNSKDGLGDRAKPYCECMQAKIESEYKDPDKVDELSMGQTVEWAKVCLQIDSTKQAK